MSDTDSFIDEVSEELRRDKLFATFKRYGWIAGLGVLLIVGGAAFTEYRKAQTQAQAETLGDSLLAAMSTQDTGKRGAALDAVTADTPAGTVLVDLLAAAQHQQAGELGAAVAKLDSVAVNGDVPAIYRQLAGFKSLTLQTKTMPVADRRIAFENLAQAGSPMRLLAEEQLALIDIETGAPDAAIERYTRILDDAELTQDLQQRALQVIVALGGEPDLSAAVGAAGTGDAQSNGN